MSRATGAEGGGRMLTSKASNLNEQLSRLVACCLNCAQACAACADAFGATGMTDTFRVCAQVCMDCTEICRTTAAVAGRYSGGDAGALIALLLACVKACSDVTEECANHGGAATAQCVDASRDCKRAAAVVKNALRWR